MEMWNVSITYLLMWWCTFHKGIPIYVLMFSGIPWPGGKTQRIRNTIWFQKALLGGRCKEAPGIKVCRRILVLDFIWRRACRNFDSIWWTLSSYYSPNLMQPKSVSLMIYISTNLVIYHPSFVIQVSCLNEAMYCVQYCNNRWCAFGLIGLGL
jgi:hypothetical protein